MINKVLGVFGLRLRTYVENVEGIALVKIKLKAGDFFGVILHKRERVEIFVGKFNKLEDTCSTPKSTIPTRSA
jgi:hypothetical protein